MAFILACLGFSLIVALSYVFTSMLVGLSKTTRLYSFGPAYSTSFTGLIVVTVACVCVAFAPDFGIGSAPACILAVIAWTLGLGAGIVWRVYVPQLFKGL